MREKARASIYTMAGFYLLYLAYQMFSGRMDNGGDEYYLMMIFTVIFVMLGAGLMVFAAAMMKKSIQKDRGDSKDTKDLPEQSTDK